VEQDVALVAYDHASLNAISAAAKHCNKPAHVHVEIDTGLSRLGMLFTEAHSLLEAAVNNPLIILDGLFMHFADSESADQSFCKLQLERYDQLVQMLHKKNIVVPYRHTSCTAALTAITYEHTTMARPGIGVYGLWPSDPNRAMTIHRFPEFALTPVLTWKTRIVQIKTVPAGSVIGYDRTYKTARETRLALLPVGYWDGYDRALSNTGVVIINGKYGFVRGRVSMNLTIVDVTDIHDITMGNEVILIGNMPLISADDMAARIGTINYEVVTRINPQLPRILVP
jgi:alanine racemase